MPSPFPGMDPFIESQAWEDFHTRAITVVAELIAPRLDVGYTAHVERRVYIDHSPTTDDSSKRQIQPDMALVQEPVPSASASVAMETGAATNVECLLPEPEQHREAFLTIRDSENGKVITVLELLSPSNKRPGSDGRREYFKKREEIIESDSHLVEIDLLRGGDRMPMRLQSPAVGEYVALVSRSNRRPRAELTIWSLRQKLPALPIPLAQGDPDVPLELQTVHDVVYDRALYYRMLKYAIPLVPPPDDDTQRWITQQLAGKNIASQKSEPRA